MAEKKALLDSKVGASMQVVRGLPCDIQLPGKLHFKLFYGAIFLHSLLNLGNSRLTSPPLLPEKVWER